MTGEIEILGRRNHSKASERYVDVIFHYDQLSADWSIPIEYRRTGTDFSASSDLEVTSYLNTVYEKCNPKNWDEFNKAQAVFWASKPRAETTFSFFKILAESFSWKSVKHDLPANPNHARRIQDLKEFGFTLATDTNMTHEPSGDKCTHILLIPLPRGGITGYETWSPALRNRIIRVLRSIDAYEGSKGNVNGLLPDHKFPEIRWDKDVRRPDLTQLTDDEIKSDFQLMTNQRNQQKREVCRKCFQTGERGNIFGVKYYSAGTSTWSPAIPRQGKQAEAGCLGCGWYDIASWRESLNGEISDENEN